MGLLDELAGSLGGSGSSVSNDQASVLVQGLFEALGSDDDDAGIDGLSRRFQSAGLGDVISSWIGTGANRSISPDDLSRVLQGSRFEAVPKRAGLGTVAGAAALAVLLPKLIDKLTPKGQVPDAGKVREIAQSEVLRSPGPFPQAAESGRPRADFSNVQSGSSSTADPSYRTAAAPAQERTYTVVAGDSLSKIAKRFYGDANQWRRIFEANRDKISNPDLIHPGQVLRVPEK
jgi:nucleoid-associated protein YgaU